MMRHDIEGLEINNNHMSDGTISDIDNLIEKHSYKLEFTPTSKLLTHMIDNHPERLQALMLSLDLQDKYLQSMLVQNEIMFIRRNLTKFDLNLIDKLCINFDPLFSKELIDGLPQELARTDDWMIDMSNSTGQRVADFIRWEYIDQGGFGIITKPFADAIAGYLKGNKCLEVMAGKGIWTKSLKDRGIDIVATDVNQWRNTNVYNDPWVDIEILDICDAIKKYNDVDYILVSWMALDIDAKAIVDTIRQYNPNVKILSIEADYTGSDEWYDLTDIVDDPIIYAISTNVYQSWLNIADSVTVRQIINIDEETRNEN